MKSSLGRFLLLCCQLGTIVFTPISKADTVPALVDPPAGIPIVTIQEGAKIFVGNVTPGVLWICENAGCFIDPKDKSDITFTDPTGQLHHTGASDQVLFGVNGQGMPTPLYATMCSDTQTVDNDDTECMLFVPNLRLNSERVGGLQGGLERIFYVPLPGSGLPGAPMNRNDKPVVYELISDVPEPASLVLLGSGLIALTGAVRRRRLSKR